jgi:hypothetical protein
MFFDNSSVRAILRTLPFAFRSTDRDDLIVDVHEKTTTVEIRILCNPRLNPWATQLAATVSAAPLVVKKMTVPYGRGRASMSFRSVGTKP